MNNIYKLVLRTRTRNARTRANANVIQALRLVVTRRNGRTIRASSETYIPSVSFCGLTYVYRKSALSCVIKCLKNIANSMPNYSLKNDIRKIVKYT